MLSSAKYSHTIHNYDLEHLSSFHFLKPSQMWSEYADIRFEEVGPEASSVDIDISFMPRVHGDKDFDGKGGVLAHAFYPYHGDVHIDEAEEWTSNSPEGKRGISKSSFKSLSHINS